MNLPLAATLSVGVQSFHRRTEPAVGPWLPTIDEMQAVVELVDRCGYESMWAGDHISYPVSILDPLLQIAQAAIFSRRLLFGTSVFLLPLRHPTPVAKQVSSLDHLTEGRLIFGVGVGGEFPKEFEATGMPRSERGARLSDSIEILRKFWSGDAASHDSRFVQFADVPMQPPARQTGGPPIWCAGRSDASFDRIGRMGDGWISYVVTPEMYAEGLDKIQQRAEIHKRTFDKPFGTGHLLFTRVDDTYEAAFKAANETLSIRYAMDFSRATERYAAVGRPQDVAEKISAFFDAGVRHMVLDIVGPYEERDAQVVRFAEEVFPALSDLRTEKTA